MEYWSNNSKKAAYFITMALTILFPLSVFAVILISMIMGLTALNEIANSTTLTLDAMQSQDTDVIKSIFGQSSFENMVNSLGNTQNQEIELFRGIFIAVCVVLLVFWLSLILLPIFRHYFENAFFKVCPIILYILIVVFGFNVLLGMSFSTLSATFPIPVVGFVTISPEVGAFVLIGFFVSIAMVLLSYINVRAKSLLS